MRTVEDYPGFGMAFDAYCETQERLKDPDHNRLEAHYPILLTRELLIMTGLTFPEVNRAFMAASEEHDAMDFDLFCQTGFERGKR